MFRWSPFPFLRLAIAFIAGILLYELGITFSWILCAFLLVIFLIGLRINRKWLTGISGLLVVVFLGWSNAWIQDPTHVTGHISKSSHYRMQAFEGRVAGNEVEKDKYFRYDFDLDRLLTEDSLVEVTGRIHLYLYKEDSVRLNRGDIVYINSYFTEIPQPKNPAEFNYSDYIKRSLIYGQSFVHGDKLEVIGRGDFNRIAQLSEQLRDQCRLVINTYIPWDRERQIAQALLIGIKDYLDQDVKTAYASVGAMHVLAVSGLHVGIIYMLLLFLLKPMRLIPYGGYLIFVCLILGIWFYAMVTGLSPSVMRAATMFSVVSLKEISIRRANIYNSLGLAALVLLLINPNFLFAVGFQLSFIAVFGIVYFHPKIYGLWKIDNIVGDKIWSISCISIAAQLATFPLSMYYFNQFPVYFLISNLIVIPGAMVLLGIGLLFLVLGFLVPFLAVWVGWGMTGILWILNEGIFLIDQLPNSLITGLYMTPVEVWLSYGVIVFLFLSFQYRSFSSLAATTFLFMGLMGSVYYRNWKAYEQRQLVFYEIPDKTVIDCIDGKNSQLLISNYEASELELLQYQIDPYRRTAMLNSISEDIIRWDELSTIRSLGPFKTIVWKGVKILIIDEPIVDYKIDKPIEVDILLLADNAVTQLRQIPDKLTHDQLLVSSDYSADLLRKLQWQAREMEIPLHSLSKDGYWMLDLKQTQKL